MNRARTYPWDKEMSMLPTRILLASDVSEEAKEGSGHDRTK
jgi:hypothetical protein